MKKKIFVLLLVVILLFALTGCAKVVSSREFTTKVQNVDTDYDAMWIQPVRSGNVTTNITHPAEYKTYVQYGDETYVLDNSKVYNFAKEKVGENVFAVFEERKYDDGTVKYILKTINIE